MDNPRFGPQYEIVQENVANALMARVKEIEELSMATRTIPNWVDDLGCYVKCKGAFSSRYNCKNDKPQQKHVLPQIMCDACRFNKDILGFKEAIEALIEDTVLLNYNKRKSEAIFYFLEVVLQAIATKKDGYEENWTKTLNVSTYNNHCKYNARIKVDWLMISDHFRIFCYNLLNDEITNDFFEEEQSPISVEDSAGSDEYISLNDALGKWRDMVSNILEHQDRPEDNIISNRRVDTWTDFMNNFKIWYMSEEYFKYDDKPRFKSSQMKLENQVTSFQKEKLILTGIQMNLRVTYNPLDSSKMNNHFKSGLLSTEKFTFGHEDTKYYEASLFPHRRSSMESRNAHKAVAEWGKFWTNPDEIYKICKNKDEFLNNNPGFVGYGHDQV